MKVFVVLLITLLLTGCITSRTEYRDGMVIRSITESNPLAPSWTIGQAMKCIPEWEAFQKVVDAKSYDEVWQECHGRYYEVGTIQASQPGYLSGIFGAAIQGGAIAGAGYYIGRGLGDSGSQTDVTQEGGGAQADGGDSSAMSSAEQSQQQSQRSYKTISKKRRK